MRIEEAIKVLHNYNKWRRCNYVPNRHPMPSPKKIGEAIDCAIHNLRTCINISIVVDAYDSLKKSINETKF